VPVGTGRNLGLYPRGVHLTGVDLSPAMLKAAHEHGNSEVSVDLREGDAHTLEFLSASFDMVVCTLSL
jgi:ubiquinone/menaquinone biosynthesis C-methylase UbiE